MNGDGGDERLTIAELRALLIARRAAHENRLTRLRKEKRPAWTINQVKGAIDECSDLLSHLARQEGEQAWPEPIENALARAYKPSGDPRMEIAERLTRELMDRINPALRGQRHSGDLYDYRELRGRIKGALVLAIAEATGAGQGDVALMLDAIRREVLDYRLTRDDEL